MRKLAVIGAGGFVGSRLVEQAILTQSMNVVPVIRSFRSLGRLARYGMDYRLGDASKPDSIAKAIEGCDAVLNLTQGDPATIEADTAVIYEACRNKKVPLLIHLSSAEVFGQVESADLNDDSPPLLNHWMDYARAKGRAENWLRNKVGQGSVAVVVLRPGLIWGPRSPWVAGPATALASGKAFLVGEGQGICNLIHVDNLIRCIKAVVDAPKPIEGFFNVGDDETLTWGKYYKALAAEMGMSSPTFHAYPADGFKETLEGRLKGSALANMLRKRLAGPAKVKILKWMNRIQGRNKPSGTIVTRTPLVTKQNWWIQTVKQKLSTQKFHHAYNGVPMIPFTEAMRSTGEWLRFSGFNEVEGNSEIKSPSSPN